MKKLIKFLSLIFIFSINGCSSDDDQELGKLTEIGLEKNALSTSWQESKVIVKSKNAGWHILSGSYTVNAKTTDFKNDTYLYSDDKVTDVLMYKDTYQGEWFTVSLINDKELQVELLENYTDSERILIINIDGVAMIQESLIITQDKKQN